MNLSLKAIAILSAALIGCKETPKPNSVIVPSTQMPVDTTDKEIYDFMKEMISRDSLKLENGLEVEPEPSCQLYTPDKDYLANFLIGSKKDPNTFDMFDRCLTKADIDFMLSQKKSHNGFKWNTSRLGFNKENSKYYYTFSIPLFSRDKTKVIMMIRDLCPGLCGSGTTILFKKENNEWVSVLAGIWWH